MLEQYAKKSETTYLFVQPLKLVTSNLVHTIGLVSSIEKTTFMAQINGGLCYGGFLMRPSTGLRSTSTLKKLKLNGGLCYGASKKL